MADVGRNRLSSILMVAAFLTIGGFLYWLTLATEPTEFAVAEEGETVEALTTEQFGQDPAAYADETVQLGGVQVDELVGTHAFFFDLPNGEPYLVRLHPDVIEAGVQLLPGDLSMISGQVQVMNDSVLQVWEAEQIFTDEQRERAATVESFIYAEEVDVMEGAESQPTETDDPDED